MEETGVMPGPAALIEAVYQEFGVLEEEEAIDRSNQVLVSTMHKAKGLEADFVYCMWTNERFMPMPGRDPEEERRVLYVALTRAKRDVILCFHEEYAGGGRVRWRALSPYLREISDHLRVMPTSAPMIRSEEIAWNE